MLKKKIAFCATIKDFFHDTKFFLGLFDYGTSESVKIQVLSPNL